MIYLASPYSAKNRQVREARFRLACQACSLVMKRGLTIISPIAHSHPIAEYGLPGDFNYWKAWNRQILGKCAELWILKIAGWKRSKGVQAEIEMALRWMIPTKFVTIKSLEKELEDEQATNRI